MDSEEENRLLSHEDDGLDRHQEEKDQETSDEEGKMSQKPSSSYSKLGKSTSGEGDGEGSLVHICDFCGKKFKSGKALGGHRRYHIQAQRKMEEQRNKASYTLRIKSTNLVIHNNNNNLIKSNSIGNSSGRCFRCLVCNKDFPSGKSLCGHMRSHPDRDWRGMNPPFVTTDNALASSSSEELIKDQDHQNRNSSSSPSTAEKSLSIPVDSSSSCSESSRLKKDMRGRKRIGEAEAAHIAALILMDMHLVGNYHLPHPLPIREPSPEKAAVLPVKKRKKNVMKNHVAGSSSSPAGTKSTDNCKEKIEGTDGDEELKGDIKVISLKKEKKNLNKKMKLGPEMIKSEEETVKQEEVKPSQSYVCDTCNRSFPCFQALGGHKTKHRNNIVKSMKGKEVVEQRQEEEQVEEDKICINGALSGEEAAALISSGERLLISSIDNENNSPQRPEEERVEEEDKICINGALSGEETAALIISSEETLLITSNDNENDSPQRQEEEQVEEEDKICINGALSGEEAAALISSEEKLVISSNDNENNSNEEEVEEARQQSASKIRVFDLNVPSSNDNENNSNEAEVEEARQQSASKIRGFDLNVPSSNDNENNSNKEEVEEARQQSASKIRGFDLNVPFVLEDEATDL
ncbi:hypothetical protein QN277_016580 [Acacia crassicarpa]|uniref:C2H2-type domain-containing protein n=1 Tax=Acacia crassicarpa TaxID=499986 RepID=A0AAE1TBQ3_9FABA|nr:hypothetical protein QN277_016580 [Acacia crassicarpa]